MAKPIKKLAIVGASVRAAAFSALRSGYEVVAADLFADADLRRVCHATRITRGYPDALADWLASTECDAWLYTGALENHPDLLDHMAGIRPLLGNVGQTLEAVRNPLRLQQVLQTAGLNFPETRDSATGLPLDGSWLCKTYRGASGAGVWRLDNPIALKRAHHEHAFFQKHVSGAAASAVYVLSADDSTLLGVTLQIVGEEFAGAKPWQYAGSIGPLLVADSIDAQLNRLGDILAFTLGLRGLVGVDLVIDGPRVWIIEVNPRYSASMEIVERMTCVPVTRAHVEAFEDSPAAWTTEPNHDLEIVYGKVILFAKRDARVSEAFHNWAVEQSAWELSRQLLGDIPGVGELLQAGQPVLTVYVSAAPADYDAVLETRVADVERRLYSQA